MADGSTINNTGATGDKIDTEDIGARGKLQRIKLVIGDLDTDGGDVASDNPLPTTNTTTGATTDTAITSDANGTVSGKLRGLVKMFADVWDSTNHLFKIAGNVASGVADAGNPVKTGGVYNSTAPTLSTGQRGDTQMDTNANIKVTQATLIAGEDLTNNKLVTEFRYSNFNISTAVTTTVKSGAGYVDEIIVVGGTLGNVTIYDNTAASGTVLCPTVTPVAGGILLKHCTFSIGLTIVTASAMILTGSYR